MITRTDTQVSIPDLKLSFYYEGNKFYGRYKDFTKAINPYSLDIKDMLAKIGADDTVSVDIAHSIALISPVTPVYHAMRGVLSMSALLPFYGATIILRAKFSGDMTISGIEWQSVYPLPSDDIMDKLEAYNEHILDMAQWFEGKSLSKEFIDNIMRRQGFLEYEISL